MTTLQWTDLHGQTHVGDKDEVMAAAFLANCHHTIKPVEHDRQEQHTVNEPITCTAPECDNYDRNLHGFGYDGVVDIHYCRACGSVAGGPYTYDPFVAEMPFTEQDTTQLPTPGDELGDDLVDDLVDELVAEGFDPNGTWTKFDGEWCARIPVDDGVDVPPGALLTLTRKSGATAKVRAGETLRRFRNTAGSWFPFVAIIRVVKED